jgi:hypothetical protein
LIAALRQRQENPTRAASRRVPEGSRFSQDPVFLVIGSPQQLQQLETPIQSALLANPQELNAYSYAEDNPIIRSDPSGRYGEISASIVLFGFGFSGGLQFDRNGIDVVGSTQAGYGFDFTLEGGWVPGVNLTHQPTESISAVAEGGAGVGLQAARKLQSNPENTDDSKEPLTLEPVIGNVGYSVGIQAPFWFGSR